jgi:hypothetical protein
MSQTKQKIATTQYDQSTLAHPHGLVYDEMMSNKCAEPGQVRKMLAFHSPDTLIRSISHEIGKESFLSKHKRSKQK